MNSNLKKIPYYKAYTRYALVDGEDRGVQKGGR